MRDAQSGFEELKQGMRGTWMAGDFGQIARYAAQGAEEFVDRLAISRGMRVLDVACGTGNLAIPAARKGAQVTGVDIAPNLVEQARQRSAGEGLQAILEEGDAEQLPYPDAQFDLVMSMFGAMFAPRPERVASELARICRRGGTIAMANWTPEGFAGKMFSLTSRYVPPPEGIPAPVWWGNDKVLRERLGAYAPKIETVRRVIRFDYPFPPRQVVQFFRDYFGPTQIAFSRLDAAGQSALAVDLEKLWGEHNKHENGRTLVSAEYLEVAARPEPDRSIRPRSSVSEETIRSLAGHVSRQMLQRYSHIRMEAKRGTIAALEANYPSPKTNSECTRRHSEPCVHARMEFLLAGSRLPFSNQSSNTPYRHIE